MRLSSLRKLGIAHYPDTVMLTDRCARDGGPLKVDVYADPRTRRSYQVDKEAGAYREADFSQGPATYGEWKKLDAE